MTIDEYCDKWDCVVNALKALNMMSAKQCPVCFNYVSEAQIELFGQCSSCEGKGLKKDISFDFGDNWVCDHKWRHTMPNKNGDSFPVECIWCGESCNFTIRMYDA